MRIFRSVFVAAIVTCCVFTGSSSSAEPALADGANDSFVLARVNGEPITSDEMLAEFSSRHAGHAKFLGGSNEARSFLRSLVDRELLLQEGYAIGLHEDPEAQALIRRYVDSKASDLLIKREVEDKSNPTQDEVRQIWENELELVLRVRQIEVQRIEDARAVRAAILSGVDSERMARSCSTAQSARNGGSLFISWGGTEPAVEEAVFQMEAGELSPIIETAHGYQVFHVIDRIVVPRPDFTGVAERIEGILRERKLDQRKAEYSRELWERWGVDLRPLEYSATNLLRLRLTSPDTVVASWEGGQLTLRGLAEPEELRAWASLPPTSAAAEVDNRLRITVNAPLADLEARRRGIPDEPELMEKAEEYGDVVVVSLLFRDHIFRGLTVTDAEGKTYFEEHRKEFSQPEERHVAHILVRSEDEAKNVGQELEAGIDFAEAAKKYSRDFASALKGGDLGWITAAKVPPAFDAVLSLGKGDVSGPLRGDSGWHLVKVLEVKPERLLDYEEVKDKLEEAVLESKKNEAREYWLEKLRAAAEIEIDDEAIAQFVKENEMKSFDAPAPGHQVPAGEMKPH